MKKTDQKEPSSIDKNGSDAYQSINPLDPVAKMQTGIQAASAGNDATVAVAAPNQVRAVYFAYIWHGFFLALTMSMLDLNTVFPALVSELTPSKFIFGLLYAIMLGAPLLFNLVFSHYLRSRHYIKKFLLFGIYLRSFAFLGMALSTWTFGRTSPRLAVATFFIWVFLFSVSAGFAGIAYADLLGKTLPAGRRTRVYTTKQFVASLASFAGGLMVASLLKPGNFDFPDNYAYSLIIGFIGLSLASLGFYRVKEPPALHHPDNAQSLLSYIKDVPLFLRRDKQFRRFILVENLASFSVMILPFYLIFAKETFNLDQSYIGQYLLFQVAGTVLSNFFWGFLAGRTNSRVIVRTCIYMGAMIPLAALALAQTSPNLFSIVFFLLGFIISGRRIGFEPYLLDITPENYRTEYLGIRGTLNIFIVILPILGGLFISQFGYAWTFIMVSLVMLVSGWLSRKQKSSPNPTVS